MKYIVRAENWTDGGFTMVPNALIRDSRISPEARTLMTFLASHQEDFRLTHSYVRGNMQVGDQKLTRMFSELKLTGWLKVEATRQTVNGVNRQGPNRYTLLRPDLEAEAQPPLFDEITGSQPPDFQGAGNQGAIKKTIFKKTETNTSSSTSLPAAFDDFWNAYAKKTGKAAALKKWTKIVKDGVDPGLILEAAKRYSAGYGEGKNSRQYQKDPTKWLNQGCYEDEYLPVSLDEYATVLPENFVVTADMIEWVTTSFPNFNARAESQRFRTYHREQQTRKADWRKAWVNWMKINGEKASRARTQVYTDSSGAQIER